MDIALDGANHHLPDRLGAGLSNEWPQDDERALHGASRDQHLRDEEVALFEPPTHLFE